MLVGIDPQQQVHAWFVDAKNYKGGSDTKYVNLDPRNLVRMSISVEPSSKARMEHPWSR